MIAYATPRLMPQLQTLWVDCFGDSPQYVRFLFEALQAPEQMLVYTNQAGVPLAMLSTLPLALCTPKRSYRAAYVYAVATAPTNRGKGISTELLQEANLRLLEQGFQASVLVPATPALFGFYAARGYETCFHTRRACVRVVPASVGISCTLKPVTLERYDSQRDAIFGDSVLYGQWEPAYLRFIDSDCRQLNGGVLGVSYPGGKGFVVCHRREDTVYIKEAAVPDAFVEATLAVLHRYFRAKEYVFHLRSDAEVSLPTTLLPFAMVKWYDKAYKLELAEQQGRSAYLAHVLD